MKNKKTTFWFMMLLAFPILSFAQERNYWSTTTQEPSKNEVLDTYTKVSEYNILELDVENFREYVLQAPLRGNDAISPVHASFPDASGNFNEFTLFKTQTLSPGLAEKFPSISSYVGISKDKKLKLRLTVTNQGVYGMVMGGEGYVYINPITRSGTTYKIFNGKNSTRSMALMQCMVEDTPNPLYADSPQHKTMVNDGVLRTYELAVATTGEYAQFHITAAGAGGQTDPQKKVVVLAAIAVTMDRVNGVYEDALALTMTLVPNNDLIIFLDGTTDPFDNNNTGLLINQSQTVIDSNIGSANYDIGHTFSTGAGGLAQLYSPCTASKARGVTGILAPVGDKYDIDFVAHEMGHQFGANHTFNNACGGNRNSSTAVEPGSGSTIMGYAGICPPNVQPHSDPVFHAISIDEIYANLIFGNGGNCPDETNISNTAPTVSPIPNYTIPYGTAFILTTDATDAEGDAMTYSWDQTDPEIATMPPLPTSTQGPSFRSLDVSNSPSRYFPSISNILGGNLTPMWEVIPNVARTMNFTATAWDNNILGGQSTQEDVTITFANTGPFVVTSQNSGGISYAQNQQITITWNVAGTTGNGINAANVDILLSYNAGLEYTETIAQNVANDGSHTLRLPIGTESGFCRIMVKGSENIFFDINDSNFTITDVVMASEEFTSSSFSITPNPNNGKFTLSFGANVSGKVHADIYDIRGRLIDTHTFDTANGLNQTILMDQPQTGIYLLQVSNANQKITKKLIIN